MTRKKIYAYVDPTFTKLFSLNQKFADKAKNCQPTLAYLSFDHFPSVNLKYIFSGAGG